MAKRKSYYDIINSDRPTLVDFYATWCGPCKMMHPILKEMAKELKGQVTILKVDIDKNQALAKKLDVMSVPTFVLYQNGQVKWRKSGGMTKAKLTKYISQYFKKAS